MRLSTFAAVVPSLGASVLAPLGLLAAGSLLVPVILLAPVPATAGDGCGAFPVVQHIFDAADQDHDGVLTPEEYADADLARYGVSFEETDANGDGVTSMEEYLDLYARHHAPAETPDDSV